MLVIYHKSLLTKNMIVCNKQTMLSDEARYKHSTNLLAVGNAGVREVFRRLSNIYDKGLLRKS